MRLAIWKRSLVFRLVLSFLMLALLTVAISGLIAFLEARDALEEAIFDRLEVTATLKSESIVQWIEDQKRDFLLLSRLRDIRRGAAALSREDGLDDKRREQIRASTRNLLELWSSSKTEWQEILLLSPESQILLSTQGENEGDYRILDRYYIEGKNDTFVQKVYPSPVTYQPTMSIATPLPVGPEGKLAILAVHLDLEEMDPILLEQTGLEGESESYLVDAFNTFISGRRFGREEYLRGVRSPGIQAALAGRNGRGLYPSYQGVPVLGVYRWLSELDAVLLTESPQEVAFAPARRLAASILGIGLVIAMVLAVGIYLVAIQIADPILRISDAAVRVTDGDLSVSVPILTDDEVGVLARTFNAMTTRLRELIDELEARNAELERFTYTVSHDLKTPLVTIRGFLGLLKKDAEKGDREQMDHDIARIHQASGQMHQLLEELLELSRIGRVAHPPEQVALEKIVRRATEACASLIEEGRIDVRIEPDLPLVWCDRLRLSEVMENLIGNAAKFIGDTETPRVEIGAEERDDNVLVFVRDNGKGIEAKYHDKIFGLFERLDADVDGTGIGLALVRRIIEVHGGRIWVESDGETGRGSTFYFTLPVAEKAHQLASV